MKKWENPCLENLSMNKTKNDEGCPNLVDPLTPPPNGSKPCNWLKDGFCTHHNYGHGGTQWPCPKKPTETIPGTPIIPPLS